MRDRSVEPPEPSGPAITPAALARVLAGCRDLSVHSSIAVVGRAATACQLDLVERGFEQVTAAPAHGVVLLREHFDCLCLVDVEHAAACDVTVLRRRLAPGATLVLGVPLECDRAVLGARLHAAGFEGLQHRVVGLPLADGASHPAVFLIAHAPRDVGAPARRAA